MKKHVHVVVIVQVEQKFIMAALAERQAVARVNIMQAQAVQQPVHVRRHRLDIMQTVHAAKQCAGLVNTAQREHQVVPM